MKRVTSIGGIFFKCKDPKAMNEWYKTHLGLNTSPYGAKVEWQQDEKATEKGYTLWTPFAADTKYFGSSEQAYMFNFRVADIEALVAELKKEGVTVLDEIEASDYGKFVHIQDIEGNKVELWEPKE
ncbi:MAG: VOC family protein [Bacteroidetes bacterium]|nr:VOC family protein [Bacteroidota bacterium]